MLTRPERLALLLNILGDEAKSLARTGLKGDILDDVESALADFEEYPPSKEEIDLVIDDFESYFELAMESADKNGKKDSDDSFDGPRILEIAEEHFDVTLEPKKKFDTPKMTGNTLVDLNRLHPYQVAQAIKDELPEIVSLVIRNVANEHAAKTLEFLPDASRSVIFLKLAQPARVTPMIQERILEVARDQALKVEQRQTTEESSEKMANLVRSLPKTLRGPMLEELKKQDAELAATVKKQLYRFEDLGRVSDRDMQQILGNCRTDTLVIALQNVEETLLNRVLNNMSKRAKEALQEEMEFQTNAKPEEIEEGRQAIVATLAELDESGSITIA